MKKRIFISHKHEDATAVKAICETIEKLPPGKAAVVISERIQHGALWFNEILDELKECDHFILLYTDEDTDWSWCMFEAGAFLHLKKSSLRQSDDLSYRHSTGQQASSTNLFFVSLMGTSAPGPFNQFQRTPATVDGIKDMFRQMFVDETDPYDTFWWEHDAERITQAAARVVDLAFGSTTVRKQYPLKHYVRLDVVGTAATTTDTTESRAWRSRYGSFSYSAESLAAARVVSGTGVDEIFGWAPSSNATWGDIVRGQPWSKKLEEEFFCLMDPAAGAPKYGPLDKLITYKDRTYLPFIYKYSVSGTGRVSCKIIFIPQEERSLPITQFSHLLQELSRLVANSHGEVINFIARTPALGALAEPDHYKELREVLVKYKGPINMITLAEEPLANFHVALEDKKRAADGSTISQADVDHANDEAATLSRLARSHLVAPQLPFLYLFSADKAAILITPSFREDHKNERITMYGLTTSDQEAINHARFLFDYVKGEYAAKPGRLTEEGLRQYTNEARIRTAAAERTATG